MKTMDVILLYCVNNAYYCLMHFSDVKLFSGSGLFLRINSLFFCCCVY